MKVLLTGASSFTGLHFARALAAAGHEVVAPLRAPLAAYADGVRAARVKALPEVARIVEDCPFGSDRLLALAREGGFNLLCHHAAEVGDYRSPDFDVTRAVAANTHRLREVLLALGGHAGILATGSVFEQEEGAGTAPLVAFSPYGLSKGLTYQVVQHWARAMGRPHGKFTIPNPFGPFEEPRFCAYLVRTWKEGKAAEVRTPLYVRDNIHVSLLAEAYAGFAARVAAGAEEARLNPSGYVESQGAFAERFARAMRARSSLACEVRLAVQTEFSEPLVRINTDPVAPPGWDDAAAWNTCAAAYGLG
jgi:nucleoside-diphosphate-sugar epimerase